jgi:D-ribose pyranase
MKRTPLLNRHLSQLVASLGHLDEIVVADAGLPVPEGVPVIDLAVMAGVPRFWDVLAALRSELVIEGACYAFEGSEELQQQLSQDLDLWAEAAGKPVVREGMTHAEFKLRSTQVQAIIRTGECTPYCNIILVSGVPF